METCRLESGVVEGLDLIARGVERLREVDLAPVDGVAGIELIRAVLAEDTWIWMCVIRLIPVGSNLLTNVAAALSGLNPLAVLFGSMLGYLPQMALFSFAGSGIALHDSSQIWMSLVMLVLSTGLGLYLYHHGFKQRLRRFRQDHSHASAH